MARTGSTRAPYAETVAKNCGTYLASITSDAENAFIASLFNADPGFFDMGYYAPDNISYKIGPWIGLVQDPQGKEPKGGWHWDSGEARR
ncbi:hypothetical protein [Ensifer sp. Root278]|uniref:hypothetical protein n=1 Tax=Ensifer sp. Root278 TaxID=1736509 RepID=UPI000708C1ED|nr:hypothetical protein [Ensifer sp. Root278]KRD64233.1 hypothetical protein ASE60_03720 [Ensifer sp. Root278]